jgi:PAS domain S-box-containing protein
MEKPLRILFVEDNKSDVEIEKRLISKEGIHFVDENIDTKEDFIAALSGFDPDIILCDYAMPRFDGMRALLLRKELAPLTPFILVTGSVNEEVAVECMKAGADDYVIKQNLIRLVPAIKAALEKKESNRLRREAEEALRASEERFRSLYENATIGIYRTTPEGQVLMANPCLIEMLGYSSFEELSKISLFKDGYIEENHRKEFQEKIAVKGELRGLESAWKRHDGSIIYVSESSRLFTDENGQPLYYEGMVEDITSRKRAEEALRQSEERFRNLYTHMAEGVCLQKLVFDHAGRAVDYKIVSVNRQYETILNLKQEDVVGKLATEVYGTGVAPFLYEYQEVVRTGIPYSFESYYEPMNKHFLISVSPWDTDGFATIFADITDRIQAEDILRQERLTLRTLIDHIPDTIYVKDAEARKVIANPADLEVIGKASESDIVGKNDLEIFPGEIGERGYNDDMIVIKTGQPVLNREEDFVDTHGKHRWLLTSKIPLTDEMGTVTGLVGIGHDITNRKQAEEQIKQKVKELAQSNDELTRFNRLAIGREMRMIELKQNCNRLAAQLGIPLPYNLDFLNEDMNPEGYKSGNLTKVPDEIKAADLRSKKKTK